MIHFINYLVYDGPADKHGQWVQERVGGVQASIVTVPLPIAFEQAIKSVKRGGRVVAIGLSRDTMTISISDIVENAIQLIGSLAGTRKDLHEALELARIHKITCHVEKRKLEDINQIFDDMLNFKISGRIVIDFSAN